ncbi:SMI1/KNR4 family protein [Mucilaginibacter mali]|uniref:SMI1/KNR4 family protein n=1 Tax=Mucilaginibacter mali TaxID=2740462 RepID=A0A7D4PWQ7_9SPHI|nr:SMI1/KNR4 family protein [Mucilaginibacter mali]QKJ32688.1 SMI1/KNR4 family protein [Mucilaginibacter mali]
MINIDEIINYLRENHTEISIELKPGASAELIMQVEEIYKLKLPDDVRKFYEFTNGFELLDDHIFNIISLEDIIDNKTQYNDAYINIAEYLIYSDVWSLIIDPADHNNYQITNSDHTNNKEITLTKSLADFLHHFIIGGLFEKEGLYHWYNELLVEKLTSSPGNLAGTFYFEELFRITGRGPVMSGQITSGKLSASNLFWFENDDYKTIIDIESIELGRNAKGGFVGLMLSKYIHHSTEKKIKKLRGSTINIYRFN